MLNTKLKALRESEKKYHDLFDDSLIPMFIIGAEETLIKVNQALASMLGYEINEMIGKRFDEGLTPESIALIRYRQKQRLAGKKLSRTYILEVANCRTKTRFLEIQNQIIQTDGYYEVCCIANDVTESQILQIIIKNTNRKLAFEHLINNSRGGKTRQAILNHIADKSYNAREIATALKLNYKTIRHHLDILVRTGAVGVNKTSIGGYDLYYIIPIE